VNRVFQYFCRYVYGKMLYYPANDTAERFSDLMGVRTFTPPQMLAIGGLGFQVMVVPDPRDVVVS
jgi:hypothetical protein